MSKRYYLGNIKSDAENSNHNGWVVGEFMEDPVRNTEAVEIKYWEFQPGVTGHATKTSTAYEVTILLEGEMMGAIDTEEITLRAGEYVAIQPGVENNLAKSAISFVRGITIKAPSDSNNKTLKAEAK